MRKFRGILSFYGLCLISHYFQTLSMRQAFSCGCISILAFGHFCFLEFISCSSTFCSKTRSKNDTLCRNPITFRFDISDGFAEITQNGTMNRNFILRDWLGTPRVTVSSVGTVVQASDIDPGARPEHRRRRRVMDLRTYTAGAEADRYRFTGHEHDVESGYDYHGRQGQRQTGRSDCDA